MLLSDDDLAILREAELAAMPETCTIRRKTTEADGAGGKRTILSDVGTSPCWRGPVGNSPQEQVIAARLVGKALYRVKLPHGTDVRRNDQLIFPQGDVVGGDVLEVVEPIADSWSTAQMAICAKVE